MRDLLTISRPRFWFYTFGPFLIGTAAGIDSWDRLLNPESLMLGLYFLFPANLLVYGVNDIFDFETDRINSKKSGYEYLVEPSRHRSLWTWIAVLNVPFLIAISLFAPHVIPSLLAFVFLSVFYSAPPIRAKAIPFLDSLFNLLYVVPGVVAYQLVTSSLPPVWTIIAGGLWTAAMHAYSAIPDIQVDKDAGLDTVATVLGRRGTHIFCTACFTGAALLAAAHGEPVSLLGLVYVGLMRWSDASSADGVIRIYKLFPWINLVAGFLLFISAAWPKLVQSSLSGPGVLIP
jgi:4-hydroxybenzoate polyprenyltransferase